MIPRYTIHKIWWQERGTRLADFRIGKEGIILNFSECNDNGVKFYPYDYFCSYEHFVSCPRSNLTDSIGRSVPARIVRIADLEKMTGEDWK